MGGNKGAAGGKEKGEGSEKELMVKLRGKIK